MNYSAGILKAIMKLEWILWLKTLRENGFGGILADDMGLGKTLRVISLLLSEQQAYEAGEKCRRSLIVCPASWSITGEGDRAFCTTAKDGGCDSSTDRQEIVKKTKEGEILITSYDLLERDTGVYQDMVFALQVIDEAQYIKNPGTQAAKGVKKITAAFKLALTGTPIENRLSELWSIFDYLMPGFYTHQLSGKLRLISVTAMKIDGRLQRDSSVYSAPIKGEVLSDLPEAGENVIEAGGDSLRYMMPCTADGSRCWMASRTRIPLEYRYWQS